MKLKSFLTGMLVFSVLLISACSSSGGDGGTPATKKGTVSGKVVSATTGQAVSGATLRAGDATVISGSDGSYTFTPNEGERIVVQIKAAGFSETVQIARVSATKAASLNVLLLPIGFTEILNLAAGGTVAIPNSSAEVTIPSDGLVPVGGGTASASVNVALTAINPAINPDVMPGDFTAVLAGDSAPVTIESFGALRVDVRDDSGERYTLRPGQSANIRIPLGTLSATPPATIPLLIFDEITGRWLEEGQATLQGTAPEQFYVGTVQRFGAWNADKAMLTVLVSGCVRDTADQPVANIQVKSNGINYSGTGYALTDVDGNFSVAMRRDALATLSVSFLDGDGLFVTTSIDVGPFAADTTLADCIVTEPVPLQMTARTLPSGSEGKSYSASLAASNGTKPYSWSVSSGALPTGLTLDSVTGVISGVATEAGFFSGTIQVVDSSTPQQSAETSFFISITGPPSFGIATQSLPIGIVGTAYNTFLSASNGTLPFTWSVTSGTLPTGLTLNSTTGQISGTPTTEDTFPITIQAEDSAATPQLASKGFSLTISPDVDTKPPTILSTNPDSDAVDVPTNSSITATFSEIMNPSTLNLATFTVSGLSGQVTYSGTTATFTPTSGLEASTQYTATITTGAKDASDNALATSQSWSFDTQSVTASGSLDLSFNSTGKVTTDFGAVSSSTAKAVAIQADGKIVAAGQASVSGFDFALARYNTNGSLDTTFGTSGKVTTDFGFSSDIANALAIQADGKIVAAGQSLSGASGTGIALARYNTNGSLDTGFGTGGRVTPTGITTDTAKAIGIQADGKIIVAGGKALIRYKTNGSLDTDFGTDGRVSIGFGASGGGANALAIQSNGKIIIAGDSGVLGFSGSDFNLARYNTDGSLDTTFDTDGMLTTDFGAFDGANTIAIQADGKIVATGTSSGVSGSSFALARYNTDGSLDTSFDTDGKIITNFGVTSLSDFAQAVAIQADGKIIAVGWNSLLSDFALARYNTNGSLDPTFSTDGKITTNFENFSVDFALAVAIQSNGRIVAAGSSGGNFALARYLP